MEWAASNFFKHVATDDALVKFSDEKTLPFIAFNYIVTDFGKMKIFNFTPIFQYENLNLIFKHKFLIHLQGEVTKAFDHYSTKDLKFLY